MNYMLVLLRHGQSAWNLENRFTGWVDVPLSEQGVAEAKQAGVLMRQAGLDLDVVHTSLLKRAIQTSYWALDELDQLWIPTKRSWRLNERHYGALQGLDKKETALKHGEEQIALWRRSYDVAPPELPSEDPRHPRFDPRYRSLAPDLMPATESLKDTVHRLLPYWHDEVVSDLRCGRRVLVTAHGNSLRALVKHLEGLSEDEVAKLNIPTGVPLVYELDAALKPIRSSYLGDADVVAQATAAVANQSKV